MDNDRVTLGRRVIRAGAVAAALLLLTGATWHAVSAQSSPARPTTAPPAQLITPAAAARGSYADVVKTAAPAVVTIRAEGRLTNVATPQFQFPDDEFFRRFFGDPADPEGPRQPRTFRQSALGSGVIVTAEGYVLTNQHVVDGAEQIRIEMSDGRTLAAKVVGSDRPSDLALLKVEASGLPTVAIGDSDAVQVGDVVLAVGNPLGVGQTVTMGIISAKGRSTGASRASVSYEDFLQTDAPINQGNSGGALVNLKGELIGINTQIVSNSGGNIGIGFAIPSNMVKHVMDDLRTKGRVTRAQLGVTIQPVTSDMAASLGLKEVGGAIISSVMPGSAAERAGLKRGDIIKAFNGQPVRDTNTLRNRVADSGPGSVADITITRDGSERHVSARLDEADTDRMARGGGADSRGGSDQTALGVSAAPLTPELAARQGLPRDTRGVLVQQVDPDGRAAAAGIQAGDVIEEVNRQPVASVDELREAVSRTTDRPLLLLVNRQGSAIFVTVRPANG
jgi:Do/DeqQ family serine protease